MWRRQAQLRHSPHALAGPCCRTRSAAGGSLRGRWTAVLHLSTQALPTFVHDEERLDALLLEVGGGGETGQARANDHDVDAERWVGGGGGGRRRRRRRRRRDQRHEYAVRGCRCQTDPVYALTRRRPRVGGGSFVRSCARPRESRCPHVAGKPDKQRIQVAKTPGIATTYLKPGIATRPAPPRPPPRCDSV